ncbi:MATE efflux family protein 5 [Platanthera guangdongensis]|uniref:MATE efflux family protein 5 n=1 Tax=Platanthera guangdongensis TaxID=2320717 RepID=A0ABR2LRA8_9ASPA
MLATGLLLYSRSIVSMLFLGRLGPLALAGGSLAIGFANITGYSVLSGLAIGMEPICGQAAGAGKPALLFLTLRRTVILLLAASLPIAVTWSSIRPLLLFLGQSEDITRAAESYLLCSLPDLLLHSLLHPLRVFLRTQSQTLPLASSAAVALFLHLPANYLLVTFLGLGIRGVAFAAVLTNLSLTLLLSAYVHLSGLCDRHGDHEDNEAELTHACSRSTLISLALQSCVSVCLEWWWYEIMVLLCGLLVDPKSTVAAMGILIQTTSFIYIFPSSLGFGISTEVSYQLGAGRPDRARRASVVGIWCGALLGATALCFAVAVRGKWALMFTADADIAGLAAAE